MWLEEEARPLTVIKRGCVNLRWRKSRGAKTNDSALVLPLETVENE